MEVGTEVLCPLCEKVMVRCIKKPELYQLGWAECFELVEYQGMAGKDLAVCPHDNTPFMGADGLYTKDGWGW